MNGLLAGSLALSMLLGVGQTPSESPAQTAPPVATLGRPVAVMGKPIALDSTSAQPPVVDRQLKPVGFSPPAVSTSDSSSSGPLPDAPLPLPRTMTNERASARGPDVQLERASMPRADGLVQVSPEPPPLPTGPALSAIAVPSAAAAPSAVIGNGAVQYGQPVGTTCGEPCGQCNDCACCPEAGWRRRLPFFQGGCTDYGDPPSHFYGGAEYLLWNVKNDRYPPLVTTSPVGTPAAAAGVLPGATILYPPSNGSVFDGLRSGGRFNLGWWFGDDQCLGLETSFFFLGDRSTNYGIGSGGSPIVARPFYNVPSFLAPAAGEASEFVAFPGEVAGAVNVHSTSQLYGADIDFRTNLCRNCCWRLDLLGGFRWVNLTEGLDISENLQAAPGFLTPIPGGGTVLVNDSFHTTNNFYGGQIGLDLGLKKGRWSLDFLGKVALGDMNEVVRIEGTTAFPAVGVVSPGGLLALPSNMGTYTQNRFAVVPEAGVKLGYQCTDHMRLFVGYSFLYLSDVARPGEQIDRNINITQIPIAGVMGGPGGATSPAVTMNHTNYWAQGVNFGIEFRF